MLFIEIQAMIACLLIIKFFEVINYKTSPCWNVYVEANFEKTSPAITKYKFAKLGD